MVSWVNDIAEEGKLESVEGTTVVSAFGFEKSSLKSFLLFFLNFSLFSVYLLFML